MREKVLLICNECLSRNYVTTISKEQTKVLEIKVLQEVQQDDCA